MSEPAVLAGLGCLLLVGFATGWVVTRARNLFTAVVSPAIGGVALVLLQRYSIGSTLAWALALGFYLLIPLAAGYLVGAVVAAWRARSSSPGSNPAGPHFPR